MRNGLFFACIFFSISLPDESILWFLFRLFWSVLLFVRVCIFSHKYGVFIRFFDCFLGFSVTVFFNYFGIGITSCQDDKKSKINKSHILSGSWSTVCPNWTQRKRAWRLYGHLKNFIWYGGVGTSHHLGLGACTMTIRPFRSLKLALKQQVRCGTKLTHTVGPHDLYRIENTFSVQDLLFSGDCLAVQQTWPLHTGWRIQGFLSLGFCAGKLMPPTFVHVAIE